VGDRQKIFERGGSRREHPLVQHPPLLSLVKSLLKSLRGAVGEVVSSWDAEVCKGGELNWRENQE